MAYDQQVKEILSADLSFSQYLNSFEEQLSRSLSEPVLTRTPFDFFSYIILGYNSVIDANKLDDLTMARIEKQKFINDAIQRMMMILSEDDPSLVTNILNYNENSIDSLITTAQTLYHFLYINRFENVKTFFFNYILKRRKVLLQNYRKDHLESSAFALVRQSMNDDERFDTKLLITGLPEIIQSIINSDDLGCEEFVKYMIKGDEGRIDNFTIANDDWFYLRPEIIRRYIGGIFNTPLTYSYLITELSDELLDILPNKLTSQDELQVDPTEDNVG